MVSTNVTLTKWGNGRGILLPKEMCDALEVEIGEKFSVMLDEANRIIRIENPESFTLHALMSGYEGPTPKEIDVPGESVGNEVW